MQFRRRFAAARTSALVRIAALAVLTGLIASACSDAPEPPRPVTMGDDCDVYFETDGEIESVRDLNTGQVVDVQDTGSAAPFVDACFDSAREIPADELAAIVVMFDHPEILVVELEPTHTRLLRDAGLAYEPPTWERDTHTFLAKGREWTDIFRATTQIQADDTIVTTWELLYEDPS